MTGAHLELLPDRAVITFSGGHVHRFPGLQVGRLFIRPMLAEGELSYQRSGVPVFVRGGWVVEVLGAKAALAAVREWGVAVMLADEASRFASPELETALGVDGVCRAIGPELLRWIDELCESEWRHHEAGAPFAPTDFRSWRRQGGA